ncbi:MAG: hypothetical protein AAFQ27_14720, partial [Pseudomonadota bacterium]
MLRQIFSALALVAVPLVTACQSTADTSEAGWLSGRIVDPGGAPLKAEIKIGDEQFTTDARGYFS